MFSILNRYSIAYDRKHECLQRRFQATFINMIEKMKEKKTATQWPSYYRRDRLEPSRMHLTLLSACLLARSVIVLGLMYNAPIALCRAKHSKLRRLAYDIRSGWFAITLSTLIYDWQLSEHVVGSPAGRACASCVMCQHMISLVLSPAVTLCHLRPSHSPSLFLSLLSSNRYIPHLATTRNVPYLVPARYTTGGPFCMNLFITFFFLQFVLTKTNFYRKINRCLFKLMRTRFFAIHRVWKLICVH